ncbi:MAG: HK97 family phage prohead protease [Caulobacterales bacterium]|nr:HK97 family phage prohead protease [Caulobacterales bacterium]
MEHEDAGPGEGLTVEGYASLFDRVDIAGDRVRRGAFAASLTRTGPSRVRMLFQHESDEPIGVWDHIAEDGRGLFVRGRVLPAGPRGRVARSLIQTGAVDGLSIGFRAVRAGERRDGVRELLEVDLWEVSIVTFPMAPLARLHVVGGSPARHPALIGA